MLSSTPLGIVVTFVGLGTLLSLLFGATGIRDFAADPWVNLLIAAIFIAFALNLFGAYEIVLPAGVLTGSTEPPSSMVRLGCCSWG
jgi:thiol:disulfide interchange protein